MFRLENFKVVMIMPNLDFRDKRVLEYHMTAHSLINYLTADLHTMHLAAAAASGQEAQNEVQTTRGMSIGKPISTIKPNHPQAQVQLQNLTQPAHRFRCDF